MKKILGKISYTMDQKHPDIQYVKDWSKERIFTFDDTYTFYDDFNIDDIKEFITNDLKLVAGGGYDYKHIHHVKVEITQI